MTFKIYNTLSKKLETFKPIEKGKVKIYVCGPTVNDVPHLGHARQQITFDLLRKYLEFKGNDVTFVSNITDIDDKIINKAKELGIEIKDLTERNLKAHKEDYEKIGIRKPDVQPKATGYIKEMIDLVKKLEEKKYAYLIEDDGVYFDISKFKGYGKLSGQKIKDLKAGARIKVKDKKRNKEDFVLWKFSKLGEPKWKSPWGYGRPGWHIECSAMSANILGLPLDIHGGGQDLIFPHHEDEIAQSEAAYGKKLSNYWIHNGMVNINNTKMSKSLGNFKTIKDIFTEYSGEAIRYFVISGHYRKPLDFSKETLENIKNSYNRLRNITSNLDDDGKTNKDYINKFKEAMDDDLNTPAALAVIWKLVRDIPADGKYRTIKQIDMVLGLNLLKKEKISIPKDIQKLAIEREKNRKQKDFEKADKIRKDIEERGYLIDDTSNGPKISLKN
ncbi:cysteine--tRNA ligase [Candidatus Pacearchaeota archaeon]|nr:cysteine--tRNA ligase [Candidatus Pacearchaeota archaeon]